MENWKKILIGIAAGVIVLIIGGITIYNNYIVPKYIEPALELASEALNDVDVQQMLTEWADELVEDGVLEQSVAKNYVRQTKKYNSDNSATIDDDELSEILNEEDLSKALDEENKKKNEKDNESMIIAYSSSSNIGIETIQSDSSGRNSQPSSYHTYSEKQEHVSKNQESNVDLTLDNYVIGVDREVIDTDGEEEAATKVTDNNSLYKKVINAMNAHERSVFFSVVAKVDVSELKMLYNEGDKEGIKSHLKSRLSGDQYSEAVSIFYKYASLVFEN